MHVSAIPAEARVAELQRIAYCLVWVLGTELTPFSGAASILNYGAISPVPKTSFDSLTSVCMLIYSFSYLKRFTFVINVLRSYTDIIF